VPAKDRLRLDQQSRPCRSGEALPQGGHHHPIARTPAHPLDLALEHLNLAAEREHLGLKLGLIAMTRRKQIQDDTD